MSDERRKMFAEVYRGALLLGIDDGLDESEIPFAYALLAEFDELQRENEKLRRENDELRQQVAQLLGGDLPGEEWRDVAGYEGLYQVSNMGRVKSFHHGKVVVFSPKCYRNRYPEVYLSNNGRDERVLAHRLVAQTFIPNPEGKEQVNHKNGVKSDNRIENLEWVTGSENMRHAYRTGLAKPCRRLTAEQVRYIRENPDRLCQAGLAEKFGVSVHSVSLIQQGKTYKDVK